MTDFSNPSGCGTNDMTAPAQGRGPWWMRNHPVQAQ
jgi:hypothetical protein